MLYHHRYITFFSSLNGIRPGNFMFIFSSRSFYLPTCTPVATYLLRPQPPKELLQTVSYIVIITAIYW